MALAHSESVEYQVRQIDKQDNYCKSIKRAQVTCRKTTVNPVKMRVRKEFI